MPFGLFSNQTDLVQLDLSSNTISVVPRGLFSHLTKLSSLNLSSNNIAALDAEIFSNLTSLNYLSLSFNKIEILPDTIFANLNELQYLDLSHNRIRNLTDGLFCCVKRLEYLFLQHNSIPAFNNYTFGNALSLKYLLLNHNQINVIPKDAFLNHRRIEILMLSDNIINEVQERAFGFGDVSESPKGGMKVYMIRTLVPELNLYSFYDLHNHYSELTLNDDLVGTLRYYTKQGEDRIKIYLNPTYNETEAIEIKAKIYEKADLSFVSTFLDLGFTFDVQNHTKMTQHFKMLPCPEGTYSLQDKGCVECPPGGFISDSVGLVATECQKCPIGAFVSLEKQPGKRHKHCRACPRGTNTERMAGLMACNCLDGFYRTHIFGKCWECDEDGLDCKGDYLNLKPGYWWAWQNATHKDRYRNFTSNLNDPVPAYEEGIGQTFMDFTYPMPKPTKCPRERSCKGGVASLDDPCIPGYTGPVCGMCSFGYYKQIQSCKECPTKKSVAIQLGAIVAALAFIAAVVMWYSRKKVQQNEGRALIDIVFARLKIIIGFYQVTYGLLEAFSYVSWPDALDDIAKYSEILQLNFLQIAPLHCLFPGLKVDAFGSLFAAMGLNVAAIGVFAVIYWIRKLSVWLSRGLSKAEKAKKLSHAKELIYRNLFFFLFVTYLSTCSKTANVLPPACRRLCLDKEETLCDNYLKADYGIKCRGSWYHLRLIVAYVNIVYIIALPAFSIIVLWRERRVFLGSRESGRYMAPQESKEIVTGLRFLYENYRTETWYWELIEMMRKIALTSGLIVVGQESRATVGVTCVFAALYGMLFAYTAPIQDFFENKLMVTALSVTFVNLGIGAVSRIPAENRPPAEDPLLDTLMFKITVIGANTLVIGQLIYEYFSNILLFLKQWIKHPHFSATCCQSLLLPVHELQDDTGDLISDSDVKEQMQMEGGELETSPIHPGGKHNEGFEVILEENEYEEVDYRALKRRAETIKEPESLEMHEVDLGVGTRLNKASVRRSAPTVPVDEVDAGVHEVDVGVDGIGGKQSHYDNLGFNEDGVGVNDVDVGVNEPDVSDNKTEDEVEEEAKVEMCDQEIQTDLSLLDEMDDEEIEQLGFAHDESLCQRVMPDEGDPNSENLDRENDIKPNTQDLSGGRENPTLEMEPDDETLENALPQPLTPNIAQSDQDDFVRKDKDIALEIEPVKEEETSVL